MAFKMRTSKPGAGNKYYNNGNNGGYSWCVNGSPKDKNCNVLANCVGYACGRFNEIIGSMKYKAFCCNAENFIEVAKKAGLKVGNTPKLGAIMVWQKGATLSGNDGAGHVAIVEKVYSNNKVYTSESAWGGSAFWNATRTNSNGRWGMGSGYKFRGFIYNPAIKEETKTTTTSSTKSSTTKKASSKQKFAIGAKVIINGKLYKSSTASSASSSVKNKTTYITRYASGTKHPYNTTGDLGWMDESSIKAYTTTKKTYTVKSGDTLSGIAAKYGMTWQQLYAKNKFVIGNNPNKIKPGQVLTI